MSDSPSDSPRTTSSVHRGAARYRIVSAQPDPWRLGHRSPVSDRPAQMGLWEWDSRLDRILWSDGVHHLYGLAPGQFDGTYAAFVRRVHPDDRQVVHDALASALLNPGPVAFEHRAVLPDGRVRLIAVQAEVIVDETGRPARMIGACQDVTGA